jgi:predicted DsbA family dithiol-disulfide isomerase
VAEEGKESKITIKLPKLNVWMVSTLILVIAIGFLLYRGTGITGRVVEGELTKEEAARKAIDYINKNLVQAGTSASLVSVKEFNGLYEITTSYQGRQIPVYITKDGRYLFLTQPIDTSQKIEIPTQPQQAFDAPDREKPEVNLFVMSFCPFGVQAENIMKEVVDLLGTKIDIKIRFIANVQGDTVESVQSLHGINEAKEDLRQACIQKYYKQETFWNYLMEINKNCYSIYRDASKLEECWKSAAQKYGIDISTIESCAYSSEGLNLLKEDEQLTEEYGVRGSPTLIINGATYSGARNSEAFKQAICSGFITKPEECSQTLSSAGGSTTGGC